MVWDWLSTLNEAAIRQMQDVVKEAVFFIPKTQAATVVTDHDPGDAQEVLKEFTGSILSRSIRSSCRLTKAASTSARGIA